MVSGRAKDLSAYLAFSTVDHVARRVGGSGFKRGLFGYDPKTPDQFVAWDAHRLTFRDQGSMVSIILEHHERDVGALLDYVYRKVGVPSNYREVVQSVEVTRVTDGIRVDLTLVPKENSQGRTANREKLFQGVYHCGVKPILAAILEAKK